MQNISSRLCKCTKPQWAPAPCCVYAYHMPWEKGGCSAFFEMPACHSPVIQTYWRQDSQWGQYKVCIWLQEENNGSNACQSSPQPSPPTCPHALLQFYVLLSSHLMWVRLLCYLHGIPNRRQLYTSAFVMNLKENPNVRLGVREPESQAWASLMFPKAWARETSAVWVWAIVGSLKKD